VAVADDELGVEREDHVAVVTLRRPDRLNALTHELVTVLRAALVSLDEDPAVRCIVLTGEGRAFSSGADLTGGSGLDGGEVLRRFYNPLIEQMVGQRTPLVAAVNGVAAGAGASLTFACDLRVAAESASFRLAFAGVGLVPDAGATWLLPRLVGVGRATELALLGRPLTAPEALQWGLVARTVPDGECLEAARATAEVLARQSSSVGTIRALVLAAQDRDLPTALEAEAAAQKEATAGADYAEARAAFREKRKPRFVAD
jgi:2-(1,2-epoxy-1,2-dihydrophenyl)acetyl-CoA isomerase